MIAVYFEQIENTKTDICAECKFEIVGNKYQMILQVGGATDLKPYDVYLCESCTITGVETGAET